jgi:acetyl esterase/lipase
MRLAAVMSMLAAFSGPVAVAQSDHPPIYYELPGMERARVTRDLVYKTVTSGSRRGSSLALDVYMPEKQGSRPAPIMIFVHGGLGRGSTPQAKDWPSYQSWGRLAAASGMIGVVMNHRLTTDDNVDEASADLLDAIAFVLQRAAQFGADPNRVCAGFYSAGGVVSGVLLRDAPNYLKCVVLYYPYLDLEHLNNKTIFREAHSRAHVDSLSTYSPREALVHPLKALPPIFLARAGRDEIPHLNESVDRVVATALERNVGLDFYTHPAGVHGFDLLTRDARTREIITQTFTFLARHLQP